jgi:hypothetical protein
VARVLGHGKREVLESLGLRLLHQLPGIRFRGRDLIRRRRHPPDLPVRERHADLYLARPELVADTHGVVEARASTPFPEDELDPHRRPAGILRRNRRFVDHF